MIVTASELAKEISKHPDYKIILCAEEYVKPSPWCDDFTVEVDHKHEVIRLSGKFI